MEEHQRDHRGVASEAPGVAAASIVTLHKILVCTVGYKVPLRYLSSSWPTRHIVAEASTPTSIPFPFALPPLPHSLQVWQSTWHVQLPQRVDVALRAEPDWAILMH